MRLYYGLMLFLVSLLPLINCGSDQNQVRLSAKGPSGELAKFHKALIDIPSVTGSEKAIGEYLVSHLNSLNFSVEKQQVKDGRFNVYAYIGPTRRTSVLLTTHIDTVPPFYKYEIRKVEGEEVIWGRGSVDAKASLAAMVQASLNLWSSGQLHPGQLGLMFVIGEETNGIGMRAVNELSPGLQWDSVIFGEPTEGKLVCGHKGLLAANLTIHGHSAHSGYPWLGENALDKMIKVLNQLLNTEFPRSKKYGDTTLNIGKVTGGSASNVVADFAVTDFALRLAAGSVPGVKNTIESVATNIIGDGKWEIVWSPNAYPPQDCTCDVTGFKTNTVNYGTDVPNLLGNHTRYLYGPGTIFVAHSDHEYLTFDELEGAVDGYERIVRHALQKHA